MPASARRTTTKRAPRPPDWDWSSSVGPMPVVRAEGLTKRYPGAVVGLRSLDLEIEAGEMVALLGPSGSGKTTFFRLLGGALRPTDGQLALLGHNMRQIRAPELRQL